MHVHFLDPYRAGTSPVHTLDPRIKLVLALAFILTTSLTPIGAWPIYVLLLAIALSVVILSELGVSKVLRRSSLALPFVLAALPLAFSMGTQRLFAIPLGFGELTVFAEGLERFASIAVRSWISVQVAIVLASTTPFPDLMLAMRAIRVPRLLVSIFGLMWRYIFVMADEAQRLMRARQSRSAVASLRGLWAGGSVGWRARVTGSMAGNLFVRSLERGDRIYSAMSARGYDGEVRTLGLPRVSPGEWALLFAGVILLLGLLWLSFLLS
ncbi:MAG TPA: cobalt ECF transporter T component CbiQ [Chloroflexia bacterium]|nr:cobalt ECF transporter T component CbiQ [Chloroflexia bacterium]